MMCLQAAAVSGVAILGNDDSADASLNDIRPAQKTLSQVCNMLVSGKMRGYICHCLPASLSFCEPIVAAQVLACCISRHLIMWHIVEGPCLMHKSQNNRLRHGQRMRPPPFCIPWGAILIFHPQGIMGRFKKNMAMVNNQGIDVVVNKSRLEEPLLKLKKRSKPLKVSP